MTNYLYNAAYEYNKLCQQRYLFTFSNGESIYLEIFARNFVHLAGLRKLSDVNEFQSINSAMNIFKDILAKKIDDLHLQLSEHYDIDAKERIENLARLSELIHTDKAVWNFDNATAHIASNLKSKVILFKYDGFNFYLTLGLAENGNYYYPETFFLRFDDHYLKGQNIVDVLTMKIMPIKKGKV